MAAAAAAGARNTHRVCTQTDGRTDRQTCRRTDGQTLCGVGGHSSGKKRYSQARADARRRWRTPRSSRLRRDTADRRERPPPRSPAVAAAARARAVRQFARAVVSAAPPYARRRTAAWRLPRAAASATANLYTGAASKSPGSRERSWTRKSPSPPPPYVLRRPSSRKYYYYYYCYHWGRFCRDTTTCTLSHIPPLVPPRNANRIRRRRPSRSRSRICRGRLMN